MYVKCDSEFIKRRSFHSPINVNIFSILFFTSLFKIYNSDRNTCFICVRPLSKDINHNQAQMIASEYKSIWYSRVQPHTFCHVTPKKITIILSKGIQC